jgi:hypothetical protein
VHFSCITALAPRSASLAYASPRNTRTPSPCDTHLELSAQLNGNAHTVQCKRNARSLAPVHRRQTTDYMDDLNDWTITSKYITIIFTSLPAKATTIPAACYCFGLYSPHTYTPTPSFADRDSSARLLLTGSTTFSQARRSASRHR